MTRTLQTRIRRRGRFGPVACALVVGLTFAGPAPADDDEEPPLTIYQWTDRNGTFRYTPERDRVPGYARDSLVTIQAGDAPPSDDPVYFKPDPKAPVITVPTPLPEAGAGQPYRPPSEGDQWGEYDARIREVEGRIAEYEEALKTIVSTPGADADTEVTPEMREIARRLPQLQSELAALYRGRSDPDGP